MRSKGPFLTTVGGLYSGIPGLKVEWDEDDHTLLLHVEEEWSLRIQAGDRTLFDSRGAPAERPARAPAKRQPTVSAPPSKTKAAPARKPRAKRVTHD